MLVPEIGLTPQLVGVYEERFDAPLALLHSGLNEGGVSRPGAAHGVARL